MSQKSDIEWTGSTWNPIRARIRKDAVQIAESKSYTSLVQIMTGMKSDGVTPRVVPGETWGYHCEVSSPGCQRCYACTLNRRTLPAWGTGLPFDRRSRDLVEIYLDETELLKPIIWKRPTKIFPASMTDLFADFVSDEMLDRIIAVTALADHHTFQFLSKRSSRMAEYFLSNHGNDSRRRVQDVLDGMGYRGIANGLIDRWPLSNVQLGFSAEDQERFNERWEFMRELDIHSWFVWASLEPLLGPIDASSALGALGSHLSWAVTGGESGPRARPMEVKWITNLVRQFRAAKVPLFVKQLGSIPLVGACRQQHYDWGSEIGLPDPKFSEWKTDRDKWRIHLKDRKGGDPSEWADHLRVREFPQAVV